MGDHVGEKCACRPTRDHRGRIMGLSNRECSIHRDPLGVERERYLENALQAAVARIAELEVVNNPPRLIAAGMADPSEKGDEDG